MAGKELRADIVIGGKADNTFTQLGSSIAQLGTQVNQVSQQLIDFGKESVQAYMNYEDAMLDAQIALSTQYQSTSELGRVMDQLNSAALNWASTTRFTTTDVAKAISNAAHAGWDLQQIMSGIPAAMNISMAGGMELSQGLEYLVDITNAAGLSFEELGTLVDMWAVAANSSSTTIPEMGQAMQRMGATMQFFKGDMGALTTMLAVLADNGTKGSDAGTLLRNSIIRLIAPTKKAAEAMGQLKISESDLNDIYADTEGLESATELLKSTGFSAYTASGQMKPLLQMFEQLYYSTNQMTEQDRNTVLSAMFPTRTITGALALLDAAGNAWDGLSTAVLESEGYAAGAAKTMESGVGGSVRMLQAAYDTMQTIIGKSLSKDVSGAADALTGVLQSINSMDPAKITGFTSGLQVIAAAGPALIVAGTGMKAIGAVMSTGLPGQLLLLSIALGATVRGIHQYNEAMYEAEFGNLTLDSNAITGYLTTVGSAFNDAYSEVNKYNGAVEQAFSDYNDVSTTFSESIVTKMVTGATLTEADITNLMGLGDQMYQYLVEGIDAAYSKNEAYVMQAGKLASVEAGVEGQGVWSSILLLLNSGFESAIAQAESLSSQLRNAMLSAFKDGTLSEAEAANIQSIMDEMNNLMAQQAAAQRAGETAVMLHKAQNVGLEGLNQLNADIDEQLNAHLQQIDEGFVSTYATTKYLGDQAVAKGEMTQQALDNMLSALESNYQQQQTAEMAEYNLLKVRASNSAMNGSDFGDSWNNMMGIVDAFMTGALPSNLAGEAVVSSVGKDRAKIQKGLGIIFDALGGAEAIANQALYFESIGNTEGANAYKRLYAADALLSGGGAGAGGILFDQNFANWWRPTMEAAGVDDMIQTWSMAKNPMTAQAALAIVNAMGGNVKGYFDEVGNDPDGYLFRKGQAFKNASGLEKSIIDYVINGLGQSYDFESILSGSTDPRAASWRNVSNDYAAYQIMNGQAGEQSLTVPVQGDTAPLSEAIEAHEGDGVTAVVTGDTTQLSAAIAALDGQTVNVNVLTKTTGGTVNTGTTGGGTSGTMDGFAEGGRADQASIFGEAGPEWAIPEEHSARTAQLLDMAREASGFTWNELLSRNGGMNAGAKSGGTVIYSPTIYANDASGVEQMLIRDKERFMKMLREQRMRDEVEVYS